MITPRFEITQDDSYLFVKVHISSIRFNSNNIEVNVTGNVLIFHLAPYYLRLRFDNPLQEEPELEDDSNDSNITEKSMATFVQGEEAILLKVPKLNKGQIFEDLDLHSKLLARIGETTHQNSSIPKGPLIQEIGEQASMDSSSQQQQKTESLENIEKTGRLFDWEIEQTVPNDDANDMLGFKYGFNNSYNDIIGVSLSNGNDINELNDPEHTSANDRVGERIEKGNFKFDAEYYISEYMTSKYGTEEDIEINGIKELMSFNPPLAKQFLKWYKKNPSNDDPMPIEFNEKEQAQMQNNLPKKEYFVDPQCMKTNYITILSLLFSYTFEQIENEGTHNSETSWTIGKLTPQISFLDQQLKLDNVGANGIVEISQTNLNNGGNNSVGEDSIIRVAIECGIKRSLSYPLHRNFQLSQKAWKNAYYLLRGGKRLVIKALLDIHECFRFHDIYYVYNKALLDDLCSWFISYGDEVIIRSLAIQMKRELDTVTEDSISFDCISDVNLETAEPITENLTLKEMEILTESEYLSQPAPNTE
ncbi:similar to Saccharomyces cerevisiae YIL104C SHQ1 Chaperone protein required for the assembly of box H/ACA snoRNPs and thus for pre-rRNA processing [Maudiozyma barnettii]|uniref:Similar to Saccharomyces cerevisiae YIL104C SHQ1 Chaperone protein required for the assembly of box H/ACA snoRNPs and thus for pre-rRNA processing n=1 Tax=Maudiozyma barnettii TaxID=61262 RepID=A0A8H2ZFZ1_9SACH|nr:Hsp90 cochaperone SHQ1 [Kazachstania barnettii]CAB4252865.1 similar to Saccharomyces cerevisiae YIL104C SHQ1 Chaperone protein required for the assembly of box H/ACA snoRNPs and thus for pre-rRNA processing [Kazachstania barnettii]CAD1780660.1 similar to Saccharomyces cerevisiae YIL104C SHQ1 Chaperone protein required for the assembly of box H/ACA snoRNPs and thus for pre-rRNA processing [Kazachstania barnettii]